MKFHIRQKLTPTRLPIYITITLLILTSTLTSHIPVAMFVRAAEGVGGDEELAMPTSSSPSNMNKDLDWSIGSQMAILNSTTSTSSTS